MDFAICAMDVRQASAAPGEPQGGWVPGNSVEHSTWNIPRVPLTWPWSIVRAPAIPQLQAGKISTTLAAALYNESPMSRHSFFGEHGALSASEDSYPLIAIRGRGGISFGPHKVVK